MSDPKRTHNVVVLKTIFSLCIRLNRMLFVAVPTVTECIMAVPDSTVSQFSETVLAKYFLAVARAKDAPQSVRFFFNNRLFVSFRCV